MTGAEHLAVMAAALGIPPVVANASNTIGLLAGALSGSFGYHRELREVSRPTTIAVVLTCAVGAIGGAALLLALPPGVFAAAAPWLILFTCLGVGLDLELRIVNALKTLSLLAANLVASIILVFIADLNLTAIALLAVGSV